MENSALPHEVQQCAPVLANILSNKKNLYEFFTQHVKRYLPEYHSIDLNYLIQLISGEKKTITLDEANSLEIDDWINISKHKLQQHCLNSPVLRFYVHDGPINRDYLLKIIGVLDKETFRKLKDLSHAKNRTKGSTSEFEMMITICGEFGKILLMLPLTDKPTTYSIKPKPTEVEQYKKKGNIPLTHEEELDNLQREFGLSEDENDKAKPKKAGVPTFTKRIKI